MLRAVLRQARGRLLPGLVTGLVFLLAPPAFGQQTSPEVRIQVEADPTEGSISPLWNYFGFDEPNYSYQPNGRKLLGELAALDRSPVYVRVHNLLTTGDGSASLKWGSTNVYTEDGAGNPIYSWTILDRIFDTFHQSGITPLVEIGFMPEALSTHPQPYRHTFPATEVSTIYTGWAYPPKDYHKWSALVFEFVRHLRERYGDQELKSWLWEVWNEPDIGYWQGTPEEFFQLYDVSVDAVLRAFPQARIGGPDSTGPGNAKASEFLRAFLEHCAHGKNYATGQTGTRVDFISFHPKGSPAWQGDHVEMGISRQLKAIEQGVQIAGSFPEWRNTPIVLGESDPEGCAACSAREHPQNLYRNGPLYGAYSVEVFHHLLELSRRQGVHFLGAVTWAFEFEEQPPFAGFRELATNGIDKPVLNAFRMLGLLSGERLRASSSAALPSDQVAGAGVRQQPDINVLAAREARQVEILVWNYHDDDVPAPAAAIDLSLRALPAEAKEVLLEHFRVDGEHSNAFSAWKEMGSPGTLSDSQAKQLESAGQLQLLTSPAWVKVEKGEFRLHFLLPRQGLSLLRLSW
jgi:xylan 1,4-beta-xylosidase